MTHGLRHYRGVMWVIKAAPENLTDAADVHQAILAVLMDIRARLDVLRCQSVQSIPHQLAKIETNTRKRRAIGRGKTATRGKR